MIRFDQDICGNLDEALAREWLETNGLGGFASSTIAGLNTRRYHGLLVAATKPPVGRIVMLSKFEEALIIDGRRYELSANQYPGVVHPQGYKYQTGFRLDPFPVFTYEVEGIRIEKSVFMPHGENTTVIQYKFKVQSPKSKVVESDDAISLPPSSLILELRPLIAFRDYHSLTHENSEVRSELQLEDGLITIQPYADLLALNFAHEGGEVDTTSFWYRNFEYMEERERGFDFKEDLFSPFAIKFDVSARASVNVIASTERRDASRTDDYKQAEIQRRLEIIKLSPNPDHQFTSTLLSAADQFIVARGLQKTVIAGYHWFSDWGRDTMIALPGLTLSTNRPDIARSILREFSLHVDRGMLPNRFPDAGEQPEYNTVDATLWFFEAVRALVEQTGDEEFVRTALYDALVDIIDWHVRGTRYNIHVDAQGLLYSGEEGVQLTWMDAKVGDWVVTPRQGLAVEIQALWYNALRIMEELAERFNETERQRQYAHRAELARASFNKLFWNTEAGCLYDVIDGEARDASIRPNQIFAVSLPYSMLPLETARKVVQVVERDLLTPYGLRSLAPKDSQYRPKYEGGPVNRDGSYHQGTVWAWLIGPFLTAYMKTAVEPEQARAQSLKWLEPLREHLNEAGLNQVSEIFDGSAPYRPRGCIAQAWSVAEILRSLAEIRR
ncbi:MAG TPA: amylo-alpha-1,6-glucosidase [Pyrinomonadaceae bacterium]